MKKIFLASILLVGSLFSGEVKVAAAANVTYAMDDLIKKFNETNPDTKIQVTLTSSGKLTAQIKNGAPYDLFLSANMKYPKALFDEKIAVTKPIIYAQGSLAYLSATKKDFSKGIELVSDENIKKIAIANPKTAPYGKAAVEAITNAGLIKMAEPKFVYAESISQTVTYSLTAADVGFIAKSSLYSPKMSEYKEGINWSDVDPKLYTPINQGIVLLKKAQDNSEAKAFYDFMLGEDAKTIFKKFGYLVP